MNVNNAITEALLIPKLVERNISNVLLILISKIPYYTKSLIKICLKIIKLSSNLKNFYKDGDYCKYFCTQEFIEKVLSILNTHCIKGDLESSLIYIDLLSTCLETSNTLHKK